MQVVSGKSPIWEQIHSSINTEAMAPRVWPKAVLLPAAVSAQWQFSRGYDGVATGDGEDATALLVIEKGMSLSGNEGEGA